MFFSRHTVPTAVLKSNTQQFNRDKNSNQSWVAYQHELTCALWSFQAAMASENVYIMTNNYVTRKMQETFQFLSIKQQHPRTRVFDLRATGRRLKPYPIRNHFRELH